MFRKVLHNIIEFILHKQIQGSLLAIFKALKLMYRQE